MSDGRSITYVTGRKRTQCPDWLMLASLPVLGLQAIVDVLSWMFLCANPQVNFSRHCQRLATNPGNVTNSF